MASYSYYGSYMQSELYHHGIKGQKWGVRRFQNADGSLTNAGKNRYNENYSAEQRKRDQSVYSRGAVRRINREMNEGNSIQGARSKEADRIDAARKRANVAGKVGAIVGGVAIPVAVTYLANKKNIGIDMSDPTTAFAVSAGAAAVGRVVGKHGSESVTMLLAGYNPNKYRGSSGSNETFNKAQNTKSTNKSSDRDRFKEIYGESSESLAARAHYTRSAVRSSGTYNGRLNRSKGIEAGKRIYQSGKRR